MTTAGRDYDQAIGQSVAIKGYQYNSHTIYLKRTVRDIEKDSFKFYSNLYQIQSSGQKILPLASPIEVPKVDVDAMNLDSSYQVKMSNNSEGKCYIEVFHYQSLKYRLDTSDLHEKVIGDEWFGGYSFSPDGKSFVYVAVPKKEKVKSFFDDAEKSGASNTTPNRYNYDEDWGEKYEGISKLGLFILDLGTGIIKEIPGISSKETVGQPMFTPCSQGIVYTAWGSAFRKMGMIYCYQRPCEIRLVRFVDGIMGPSPVDLSNPAPVHHVSVSKGFSLARSPRFNILSSSQNNSSECYHLVFLGSKEPRDTHNSSSSLYSLDWNQFIDSLNVLSFSETGELVTVSNEQLAELSNQTIREIISSEARSDSTDATIGGYPFPGLYCGSLPLRPFVDKETLLLETQWRCHTVIVSVNILTGSLRTLHNHSPHLSSFSLSPSFSVSDSIIPHNPAHQGGSWMSGCEPSSSIVDVHPEHGLLLLTSTPTTPPVLVHITISNIKLGAMTGKSSISIPMESSQSNFFPFMSAMTSKITASATPPSSPVSPKGRLSCHILHHSFDENVSDDFESILILPPVSSSDHLPPLLVCPHGGPHSAFSTAYVAQYSDYLCLYGGYAVLLVNYRGSTGYGQSQLNALPGHIGVIDVQDVYNATQAVASLNPPLVSSKRAVFGGSHGGFLTAHMIGQYPNLFDAAALRNPVINVPAMFTTSDIPDWCVVEASGLGSYDFQRYQLPGDEQFRQMTSSSPIRYVAATVAPVLMCLGAKDKRVPWSQGLQYYYALKSQRNEEGEDDTNSTQLRVYREADHAIDKPNAEADQWISIKNWFDKYLK